MTSAIYSAGASFLESKHETARRDTAEQKATKCELQSSISLAPVPVQRNLMYDTRATREPSKVYLEQRKPPSLRNATATRWRGALTEAPVLEVHWCGKVGCSPYAIALPERRVRHIQKLLRQSPVARCGSKEPGREGQDAQRINEKFISYSAVWFDHPGLLRSFSVGMVRRTNNELRSAWRHHRAFADCKHSSTAAQQKAKVRILHHSLSHAHSEHMSSSLREKGERVVR